MIPFKSIKVLFVGVLMIALGVGGACRSYQIEAPKGFVVFDREDDFKAISADGVRMTAREIPNKPEGDLALWTRALLLQMDGQGYTVAKNEKITAATGQTGRLIESNYLIRNVKYSYWTALFIKGDKLILIESAAPAEDFQKHAAAMRRSLRGLRL